MKILTATVLAVAMLCPADLYGGSRSYSSGSRSPSRSYSSGSSRSYSSGSRSPSRSYSSGSSRSSSPRSYSSGSSRSSPGKSTVSLRPAPTNFNSLARKQQVEAESRRRYSRGGASRTSYKSAAGKAVRIDPKDVKIERLRSELSRERWVNRESRKNVFYATYHSRPPVVYNDPFPSVFWWWLLDRSRDERALWVYHHQAEIDRARLRDMYARDAQLEARVRSLESGGVRRDASYVPAGMDADLMYSDEYVDAVYNPEAGPPYPLVGWRLAMVFLIMGMAAFVFWFVFLRET